MNISKTSKYLITNYHVISEKSLNHDIKIEIHNQKNSKLNLHNRDIKYFPKPKDITIIEIKNNDEIYNDIQFLDYDLNYIKKGYNIYKNMDVFSIEHPLGDGAACASGRIININNYEFEHDISTDNGSSGCPIIILNNNINLIQVIGIHKEAKYSINLNGGTFIGEIFNDNNNNLNIDNNYIIAEIYIEDNDINKNIIIINSYEEKFKRSKLYNEQFKNEKMNEEEINKCEIRINNELIKFNYFHIFLQKGKYIIKYSFNNYLTNISYMFYNCKSLINIDLSNFNTQNVTDMSYMFSGCVSLKNINVSNLNTQNVTDMSNMFFGCVSLTNLNLSNFNTQTVKNMRRMFYDCVSLTHINLSNFNTQNVTDMSEIFSHCNCLKVENIITKDREILFEIL